MARCSAIYDVRQELANPFNLLARPEMNRHAADLNRPWSGNLPGGDVTGQRAGTDVEHLRGLPGGESLHMWCSVPDIQSGVKLQRS